MLLLLFLQLWSTATALQAVSKGSSESLGNEEQKAFLIENKISVQTNWKKEECCEHSLKVATEETRNTTLCSLAEQKLKPNTNLDGKFIDSF